ncbi:hypothetical protein NDU88_004694 [Pleurodeles waltl]|uniref:Uncharacterized protein n=1 Tax=Pleurodeles waltl TaxID=8319 RepID=A0AAV7M9Z8_PLEWA|nr:hypothetical protein NDU88_004694 [Pleurodeles waltl]
MGRAATPASSYSVSVPIAGRPQHCQGPRPRSGAVPLHRPTGRIFTSLDLGPQAPTGNSAAAGRLVRSPPPFSGRPPPSRDHSRLNSRLRLQPRDQAASPRPRGQARSARQCPPGSLRWPDHARSRPSPDSILAASWHVVRHAASGMDTLVARREGSA